jgi:LysM repeat protein
MKDLKLVFAAAVMLLCNAVNAQRISIEEYVNTYKELAIEEMKRTGVPAAITLAQGILETENGNSILVKKSNNHFGIKCKEDWKGPSVSHTDDAPWECFRKYGSAEESYRDHSNFLRTRKYYTSLFDIDPADYKAWAYGLKKAGYATNPQYAQQLIKYIETHNLQQYSLIALGKVAKEGAAIAKTETPVNNDEVDEWKAKPALNNKAVTQVPAKEVKETELKMIAGSKEIQANEPAVVQQSKTEEENKPAVRAVYPEGVFKINETKVIYAAKGTSILAISEQNAIPLSYLVDFNDLKNNNTIENDQLIYLQRKRRQGTVEKHIVKANESLYDIAQAEGIRLEALLQYNLLSNPSQQPEEGESLNLQGMATVMPKLKATGAKNITANTVSSLKTQKFHMVEPNETIYSISRKYNVPVNLIMDWNKMKGYDVKIGQELIIAK